MAKTAAQTEKEFAEFIAGTKRRAAAAKRKRERISSLVQSRTVTIHDRQGRRVQKPRWGVWKSWNAFVDNAKNVKAAVNQAMKVLKAHRIGTVIYMRTIVNGRLTRSLTPIFQSKWGNDDRPFIRWSGPAGEFWRRRI